MTRQEDERATPPPPSKNRADETLTDWIDRRDREAFRRALEQRDLRFASTMVAVQREHCSRRASEGLEEPLAGAK